MGSAEPRMVPTAPGRGRATMTTPRTRPTPATRRLVHPAGGRVSEKAGRMLHRCNRNCHPPVRPTAVRPRSRALQPNMAPAAAAAARTLPQDHAGSARCGPMGTLQYHQCPPPHRRATVLGDQQVAQVGGPSVALPRARHRLQPIGETRGGRSGGSARYLRAHTFGLGGQLSADIFLNSPVGEGSIPQTSRTIPLSRHLRQ